MSLYIHGSINLIERFRDLIQRGLGPNMGQHFDLVLEGGVHRAVFSQFLQEVPAGNTRVQYRFFQFLDQIIRNQNVRIEIEVVANQNPPFFGQAKAARQRIDLGDIERIPPQQRAFTATGVIVHEIAERFWLASRGFQFQEGMTDAEFLVWFVPAHRYALRREQEVTGWVQIRDEGSFPMSPELYAAQSANDNSALAQMAHLLGLDPPPTSTSRLDYRNYRRQPGQLQPNRRRVTIRATPFEITEINEIELLPE